MKTVTHYIKADPGYSIVTFNVISDKEKATVRIWDTPIVAWFIIEESRTNAKGQLEGRQKVVPIDCVGGSIAEYPAMRFPDGTLYIHRLDQLFASEDEFIEYVYQSVKDGTWHDTVQALEDQK